MKRSPLAPGCGGNSLRIWLTASMIEPEPVPPARPAQMWNVTAASPDVCVMRVTACLTRETKSLLASRTLMLLANNVRPKRRR